MGVQLMAEPAKMPPRSAWDHTGEWPIYIVCDTCGSDNVFRDAYAQWSFEEQKWVLGHVFDQGTCDDCGGERRLAEVIAAPPYGIEEEKKDG